MRFVKHLPHGSKLTQSQKHAIGLARRFCMALGDRTKWKPLRPASIGEVMRFADLTMKDALKGALMAERWKWLKHHAASGGYVLTDAGREAAKSGETAPLFCDLPSPL
jgi:hypothetical protein